MNIFLDGAASRNALQKQWAHGRMPQSRKINCDHDKAEETTIKMLALILTLCLALSCLRCGSIAFASDIALIRTFRRSSPHRMRRLPSRDGFLPSLHAVGRDAFIPPDGNRNRR